MREFFSVIALFVLVGEALAFIGFFVFALIKDIKRQEREKYAEWVANSVNVLHAIENWFRHECKSIIANSLSTGKYHQEITELEKSYKYDLKEKLIERRSPAWNYITSVPQYLAEEYQRNISDIADTFRYFGDLLSEQSKKGAPNGIR